MWKCRTTLLLGLASVSGSCGLAPERAVRREPGTPPSLSPSIPPQAVDHVVTYAWSRGFGPKGGDRITIYRHGNLIREDQRLIGSRREQERELDTHYSNLATGASLSFSASDDGASTLDVWRARGTEPGHERVATGERRRIAGETCRVWRAIPLRQHGVEHQACVADDGVVLQQAALSRHGSPLDERIALRVERRKVRPEEVIPPKRALTWSYWIDRSRAHLGDAAGQPNYDVRLGGSWGGSMRRRASGGWMLAEREDGPDEHLIAISHSSRTIRLHATDRQLSISSQIPLTRHTVSFEKRAIDRNAQTVLGERCTWFDVAVGISDYSRHECQSRHDLALIVEETSWGTQRRFKATSLSRGQTTNAELVPSSELLSWTRWGWPELDR